MNNQGEIKLSSNWTKVGLYIGSIIIMLITLILIIITKNQDFHIGMLVSGLILFLLVGFIVYQFIFVCDAKIVGDKIILKKIFRQSKTYSFDKTKYPTSFQIKRTKYVTVEMINDDNTLEKYLIVNSKSLLSFEKIDAEQILINLRNLSKK